MALFRLGLAETVSPELYLPMGSWPELNLPAVRWVELCLPVWSSGLLVPMPVSVSESLALGPLEGLMVIL